MTIESLSHVFILSKVAILLNASYFLQKLHVFFTQNTSANIIEQLFISLSLSSVLYQLTH